MTNNNLGCGLLWFTLYRQQITLGKKKINQITVMQLRSIEYIAFSKVQARSIARTLANIYEGKFCKIS